MGCGGSKDVANSKSPKLPAASDPTDAVVQENPAVKISRPSSLAAVDESETKAVTEAPQPTAAPDQPVEPESVVASEEVAPLVVVEESKMMVDTTLSSGTNDDHNAERCHSMAISSTDTNNFTNAEGINLEIPASTDNADQLWSLTLTPVESRHDSLTSQVIPEGEEGGEEVPSLLGETLLEPNPAVAPLSLEEEEEEAFSSPKAAAHQDLLTPNGVHSLQHADTGESCFGFQQLHLMELNEVPGVELTYDEQQPLNSNSQSPQNKSRPHRSLSGFHNPRVDASMSRQSSTAKPAALQPSISLA